MRKRVIRSRQRVATSAPATVTFRFMPARMMASSWPGSRSRTRYVVMARVDLNARCVPVVGTQLAATSRCMAAALHFRAHQLSHEEADAPSSAPLRRRGSTTAGGPPSLRDARQRCRQTHRASAGNPDDGAIGAPPPGRPRLSLRMSTLAATLGLRARGARLSWSSPLASHVCVPRRAAASADADAPRPGRQSPCPPHFLKPTPPPRSTRGRTWSSSWTSPGLDLFRRRRQDPLHVAQVRQQRLATAALDPAVSSSCAWCAPRNSSSPSPAWTSATPSCVGETTPSQDASCRCSTCPCR